MHLTTTDHPTHLGFIVWIVTLLAVMHLCIHHIIIKQGFIFPPMGDIKLVTCLANQSLSKKIAQHLNLGISKVQVFQKLNSEKVIGFLESVKGSDVFVIGGLNSDPNECLMEILLMIDGCKAFLAKRVIAVIPCYPYARQDKKDKSRAPITAKLVANFLSASGANHIITVDLHSSQIQGFFDIPVDNIVLDSLFREYICTRFKNVVIVSPDAGGAKRGAHLASSLGLEFVLFHKERVESNKVSKMILVGSVKDKCALIVDDIADTCGTLITASNELMKNGATGVYALVVHGILSKNAVEKVEESSLKGLTVTNSVDLEDKLEKSGKLECIDISDLLAKVIKRTHENQSVSSLFTL